MMVSNYATWGTERQLTALKARGADVRDYMITLPRGASGAMRADAEHLCACDDRYDWRFSEDVA